MITSVLSNGIIYEGELVTETVPKSQYYNDNRCKGDIKTTKIILQNGEILYITDNYTLCDDLDVYFKIQLGYYISTYKKMDKGEEIALYTKVVNNHILTDAQNNISIRELEKYLYSSKNTQESIYKQLLEDDKDLYYKSKYKKIELFKEDLEREFGTSNNIKKDTLWKKVYSEDTEFFDMYEKYKELSELLV